MKRLFLAFLGISVALLSAPLFAQEHFTEGPVWRVILLDIKPGRTNDFCTDLRQNVKPIYEEYKKQGVITEYAFHIKSTLDEPGDWDVAVALQYRNFAALDGLTARTDPITLKFYGSREARQRVADRRPENATVVSSFLMRQVTPKDLPRESGSYGSRAPCSVPQHSVGAGKHSEHGARTTEF